MKVNCQDYRNSMELLGLRQQLEQVTDPDEKKRILERIRELEQELHVS